MFEQCELAELLTGTKLTREPGPSSGRTANAWAEPSIKYEVMKDSVSGRESG